MCIAASASSFVTALYVSFHDRHNADSLTVTSGNTRTYRTLSSASFWLNSECVRATKSATSAEKMTGVAPPTEEARLQKKRM